MTVVNRLVKNGSASILDKLAKVCEQLMLVPFFIMYWGIEYYGDWITITTIPTFFALSNLGFGTAVGNTFILRYFGEDKKGAATSVKTGLRVMHYGIVIVILLSILIIQLIDFFGLFNNLHISSFEAKWSVFFMFAAAASTFYLAIFEYFYRAVHMAHLAIFSMAVISFIKVGVGVICLYMNFDALKYSFTLFIVTIISNIFYIHIGIRKLKFKEYKDAIFKKEEAVFLFKKGFGYFLNPLWQAIYYQGTTFIVRITLGPVAVVLFNTLRTLVNSSSQVFNIVVTAIFPEFQLAVGENDKEKSKKLYSLIIIINFILSILAIIFLLTLGEGLYSWWTHNKIHVPELVWILMIVRIVFYALWFSFSFVFQANNNPYPLTITGFFVSIVSVFITWIGSISFGVVGAAMGMLVFDILMFLIIKIKSQKYLKFELLSIKEILKLRGVK